MVNGTEGPKTYGIHLLKVSGIACQTFMHSIGWLTGLFAFSLGPLVSPWMQITNLISGLALIIAMTAGGVMRLTLPMAEDGKRLGPVNWPSILLMLYMLALGESLKLLLIGFPIWSWNALHSIAVGLGLTLFIARRSIVALWSVALCVLFITPFMTEVAERYLTITPDYTPGPYLTFPIAASILWSVFMLLFYNALAHKYPRWRKHKIECLTVWLIGCALTAKVTGTAAEMNLFYQMPIGILVGTINSNHIWPIFPWTSLVMIGFLVFDIVERHKGSARTMMTIGAAGFAMLFFFFTFLNIEPSYASRGIGFFSGTYFNRSPAVMLVTIGMFCLLLPVADFLAKRGWQTPYVVIASRSVLWLYIYQTIVLFYIAHWMQGWVPSVRLVPAFIAVALVTTFSLPWLLQRIPLRFRLTLRKSAG